MWIGLTIVYSVELMDTTSSSMLKILITKRNVFVFICTFNFGNHVYV